MKRPIVSVDILVVKDDSILLGRLAEKWTGFDIKYGVPGRDIAFGESIQNATAKHLLDETGCKLVKHQVICVNANYARKNHYIGIGVKATVDGDPRILMPEDWLVEWKYFKISDIPHEFLWEPTKHLINCYLTGKFCSSE